MIAFIIQVSLLILASVVIGFLVGWAVRQIFHVGKLKRLQAHNIVLSNDINLAQASLDQCERRQRELLAPQAVSQPLPTAAEERFIATNQSAFLDAPQGTPDDLKQIWGVGQKLEGTLNSLGLFHFWQIAQLTPKDVAWIDERLRFKGRIERDTWIEQAKLLADGKETDFMKRAKAATEGTAQDK